MNIYPVLIALKRLPITWIIILTVPNVNSAEMSLIRQSFDPSLKTVLEAKTAGLSTEVVWDGQAAWDRTGELR